MGDATRTPLAQHDAEAYHAAVALLTLGVPLFIGRPDAEMSSGYKVPKQWESTRADPEVLELWRPGDALCAVTGSRTVAYGLDVIDIDPRNGGDESMAAALAAGVIPTVYARSVTPSGGEHLWIKALDVAKGGNLLGPGLDVQAGKADGTGRGFVFLPPTERVSKADGKRYAYAWDGRLPDVEHIRAEYTSDDSGIAVRERITLKRAEREARNRAVTPAVDIHPDDPFEVVRREFSRTEAAAYFTPRYESFRNMRTPEDHGFNAALFELSLMLGHFVPEFMSYAKAESVVFEAAVHNRSVEFQGESGVRKTIESGMTKGMREPYALRRRRDRESDDEPEVDPAIATAEASEELIDPVDVLLGEMLDVDQMEALPNPEPLINGLLDLDTVAWLIGKSGSYKSFVALDMAACIARGEPWHGHAVRQGTTVYVVAEGARGMKLRMQAWQREHGSMKGVVFLPRPVQVKNREAWAILVEACRRIGPVMIALDTQARVTVGMNENDNSEMGVFIHAADQLRRATGACVLVVHHIGRNGTDARGASAIDGAQDHELRIERTADRRITVHNDKQKDQDDSETIRLGLERVDMGTDPATGRDLSSLVVCDLDENLFDAVAEARSKEIGYRLAFVDSAIKNFDGVGGTKAEIRSMFKAHPALAHLSEKSKDAEWYPVWRWMWQNNRIKIIETDIGKRLAFRRLSEMDDSDVENAAPPPLDGLETLLSSTDL